MKLIGDEIKDHFEQVNILHPNNDHIINRSFIPEVGAVYPKEVLLKAGANIEEYGHCTMVPGIYLNVNNDTRRTQPNFLIPPKLTFLEKIDVD